MNDVTLGKLLFDKQDRSDVHPEVGFYIVLIPCSSALGMFAFKKFQFPKFSEMFERDNLQGSFYDILHGLKR